MSARRRYAPFMPVEAIKASFARARRRARQRKFMRVMNIQGGERILDLGGTIQFWKDFPRDVHITFVNLKYPLDPAGFAPDSGEDSGEDSNDSAVRSGVHPGSLKRFPRVSRLTGDACDMRDHADMSFDICFSNSVIEHVGGPERERAFARNVRRLAPGYWVQTPCVWFLIEAHTNMPFWWFLPAPVKRAFRRRWARILPAWNSMIEGTTVILYRDFREMFPDAEIWTERFMLFPKSHIAYRARRSRT